MLNLLIQGRVLKDVLFGWPLGSDGEVRGRRLLFLPSSQGHLDKITGLLIAFFPNEIFLKLKSKGRKHASCDQGQDLPSGLWW